MTSLVASKHTVLAAIFILDLIGSNRCAAERLFWNQLDGSDANQASNWIGGGLPTVADAVVFSPACADQLATNQYMTVSKDMEIGTFEFPLAGSLVFDNKVSMTINGDIIGAQNKQWKCKNASTTDFFCGNNWNLNAFSGELAQVVNRSPCFDDIVVFKDDTPIDIDIHHHALVRGVDVGNTKIRGCGSDDDENKMCGDHMASTFSMQRATEFRGRPLSVHKPKSFCESDEGGELTCRMQCRNTCRNKSTDALALSETQRRDWEIETKAMWTVATMMSSAYVTSVTASLRSEWTYKVFPLLNPRVVVPLLYAHTIDNGDLLVGDALANKLTQRLAPLVASIATGLVFSDCVSLEHPDPVTPDLDVDDDDTIVDDDDDGDVGDDDIDVVRCRFAVDTSIMGRDAFVDLLKHYLQTVPSQSPTSSPTPSPTTSLFIAEYVEGTSFNKALELYNPTSLTIELSDYSLRQWHNGESATWLSFAPTATIGCGAHYSICHINNAFADDTCDELTASTVLHFNGDDSIQLVTGNQSHFVVIDQLGDGSTRTLFPVCGVEAAMVDTTLVRGASIMRGNRNWDETASKEACEWSIHEKDSQFLGYHTVAVAPTCSRRKRDITTIDDDDNSNNNDNNNNNNVIEISFRDAPLLSSYTQPRLNNSVIRKALRNLFTYAETKRFATTNKLEEKLMLNVRSFLPYTLLSLGVIEAVVASTSQTSQDEQSVFSDGGLKFNNVHMVWPLNLGGVVGGGLNSADLKILKSRLLDAAIYIYMAEHVQALTIMLHALSTTTTSTTTTTTTTAHTTTTTITTVTTVSTTVDVSDSSTAPSHLDFSLYVAVSVLTSIMIVIFIIACLIFRRRRGTTGFTEGESVIEGETSFAETSVGENGNRNNAFANPAYIQAPPHSMQHTFYDEGIANDDDDGFDGFGDEDEDKDMEDASFTYQQPYAANDIDDYY